jgi:hypothetical protein
MPRRTPPFLIRSPNSKQLECTAKNTQSSPHNHFQELVRLETSKLGVPNSPNSNSPPRRVENKKKTVFGERRRITTAGQKIMCTDAEKGGPIWPTQSTATRTHSERCKLQLPAQHEHSLTPSYQAQPRRHASDSSKHSMASSSAARRAQSMLTDQPSTRVARTVGAGERKK